MRQLDARVTSRRPPFANQFAFSVGQFLAGPFQRTPGRVIEPILAQRTDDPRLMIPLQTNLRPGNHPQTIIRKRPVADHVPQHHHPPDPQFRYLREHRFQGGSVTVDIREDGDHASG